MSTSILAKMIGLEFLGNPLSADVRRSIKEAIDDGAILDGGSTPLAIFRSAVDAAIRDIRTHPRGILIRDLLVKGPCERTGRIPREFKEKRLSDDETAKAISFIRSWMVPSFQGRLAELLAAGPASRLLRRLRRQGEVAKASELYVGDVVTAESESLSGRRKAADLHGLIYARRRRGQESCVVTLVGEVKSYALPLAKVQEQLAKHCTRCRSGLVVKGVAITPPRLRTAPLGPVQLSVVPSQWTLPRGFRFDDRDGRSLLHVDSPVAPKGEDSIERVGERAYRIILRWSHEALASAAYDLSFWYMERVGEQAFAKAGANPWPEMSVAEAGRNAATAALYYAILRARSGAERGRAVALYNVYGFGYSLGMNLKDARGRRQMLWPEDLREILASGKSKHGYQIV